MARKFRWLQGQQTLQAELRHLFQQQGQQPGTPEHGIPAVGRAHPAPSPFAPPNIASLFPAAQSNKDDWAAALQVCDLLQSSVSRTLQT